ncbi:MAG: hypothetical protein ACRCYS_10520, partial [Beijerinckiaceae bacterium]
MTDDAPPRPAQAGSASGSDALDDLDRLLREAFDSANLKIRPAAGPAKPARPVVPSRPLGDGRPSDLPAASVMPTALPSVPQPTATRPI